MPDFQELVDEKIKDTEEKEDAIVSLMKNPAFHVQEIQKTIQDLSSQVSNYTGELDDLKSQVVTALNQIPGVVETTWRNLQNTISSLRTDRERWVQMKSMYVDWLKDVEEKKKLDEDIESGKIPEPSRHTGRKRKTGEKPPTTLRKHRQTRKNAKKKDTPEVSET